MYVTAEAAYVTSGGRAAYVTAGAPYINGAGGCVTDCWRYVTTAGAAYVTGWLPLTSYTGEGCEIGSRNDVRHPSKFLPRTKRIRGTIQVILSFQIDGFLTGPSQL